MEGKTVENICHLYFFCSWTGVVGALMRDEAEIGVCTFYWTPSRSKVVTFSPGITNGVTRQNTLEIPLFIKNQMCLQVFHQVSWRGDELADFYSTLFPKSLDRSWRLSPLRLISSHCLLPIWP